MKISTSTPAIVIALVGVALFSAAPSMGASDRTHGASAVGSDHGKVILHRDGSKAVPFIANVGPATSATERGGFDWGDAAIGAGGAWSVMLLASGVAVVARRRAHAGIWEGNSREVA